MGESELSDNDPADVVEQTDDDAEAIARGRRRARFFTWFGAIFFGGLFLTCSLAVIFVDRMKDDIQCSSCLKQLGLALHNYHDVNGCFPPAYIADEDGRPMHSWRVLILPYIDQAALYGKYRFDEPWDGPNNSKLHDAVVPGFQCPIDAADHEHATWTSYVAVVGPHTCWPGTEPVRIAEITDGTSSTLLIAECRNSGIHWMEPRDLHVGQMPLAVNPAGGQGISSPHESGARVLAADGSVHFLSNDTDAEMLRRLIERDDGELVGNF